MKSEMGHKGGEGVLQGVDRFGQEGRTQQVLD
jgi:hypothetical protein